MRIGRKIFYDNINGAVLVDTGQYDNAVRSKSVDEEIASYSILSERNRETIGVLELPYGAYVSDFAIATGYSVDPVTMRLKFQYPDPNAPEAELEYTPPLSVGVKALETKVDALEMETADLWYENIMINFKAESTNSEIAELWYTILMGGVM